MPLDHPQVEFPLIASIRASLRSDMRVLRWVFLGLYVCLMGGLLIVGCTGTEALVIELVLLSSILAAQALFIFGVSTTQLGKPLNKYRLVLPIFVIGCMVSILTLGFMPAIMFFFELYKLPNFFALLWWIGLLVVQIGIGAGTALYVWASDWPRIEVLWRLPAVLLAISLAEVIVLAPSLLLRTRWLVFLLVDQEAALIGMLAAALVMLFSFGPIIVVIFLRPRLRREREISSWPPLCAVCGYDLRASRERCPECGTPIASAETRVP